MMEDFDIINHEENRVEPEEGIEVAPVFFLACLVVFILSACGAFGPVIK